MLWEVTALFTGLCTHS